VIGACLAGCGGENYITPPNEVVQNYLSALASGYYPTACSLLDRRTRESQLKRGGPHATCEKLFAKCLPHSVTRLSHDPLQLYYSSVEINMAGSARASAAVSGTAVARAIRHVTLSDERGTWKLTAYGRAIDQCHLETRHRTGKA
jgi:hypothetical protein